MGFWANFKAKRAHKSAQQQFEFDHANWVRDVEIFNQIRDAFDSGKSQTKILDKW